MRQPLFAEVLADNSSDRSCTPRDVRAAAEAAGLIVTGTKVTAGALAPGDALRIRRGARGRRAAIRRFAAPVRGALPYLLYLVCHHALHGESWGMQ